MKKYEYKGDYFTINELEKHHDCIVAGHELRRNIWRYKMKPSKAMVSPIRTRRSRCKETHFYNGIEMTSFELMELSECIVSYNTLRKALRKGVPVKYAIRNEVPPVQPSSKNAKPLPLPSNRTPAGGSISLRPKKHSMDTTKTYEYLTLQREGNYVMDKNGINIEKTVDKLIK